jgi:hypothetical protein
MLDRFLEIFVGFYKPNGQVEHRLLYVVVQNINFKFFLEIAISVLPWFLHYDDYGITAHLYALIKLPRYGRLFELDTHINNYIESTADRKTVFELKTMEK